MDLETNTMREWQKEFSEIKVVVESMSWQVLVALTVASTAILLIFLKPTFVETRHKRPQEEQQLHYPSIFILSVCAGMSILLFRTLKSPEVAVEV